MYSIIAIFFGIVQGLTEFVPVSSSGHLLLLHTLFPSFQLHDELGFDVALHVGTLVALLIVFWRDCLLYIRCAFSRSHTPEIRTQRKTAWLILLAVIPAGLAGVLFEDSIDIYLRSPWVVVVMLILIAMVFLAVEKFPAHTFNRHMASLRWQDALFIGSAQMLALIPGTSRSGITLVVGMLLGLQRKESARFSFLIAIPLIAAAGLKKLFDMSILGLFIEELPIYAIGMVTSAIVGYMAIRFMLKFLSTKTLKPFAVYRIVLALVTVIILSV